MPNTQWGLYPHMLGVGQGGESPCLPYSGSRGRCLQRGRSPRVPGRVKQAHRRPLPLGVGIRPLQVIHLILWSGRLSLLSGSAFSHQEAGSTHLSQTCPQPSACFPGCLEELPLLAISQAPSQASLRFQLSLPRTSIRDAPSLGMLWKSSGKVPRAGKNTGFCVSKKAQVF